MAKLTLEELPSQDATEKEQERKVALLQRVTQMRTNVRRNMGREVDQKDPAKHYIWAHFSPERIAHWEGLGYEIVKTAQNGKGAGNSKASTKWGRQDGTHRHGDSILMQVDLEIYDAYQTLAAAEAMEHDRRSPAGFTPALQQFARETGVPITISQDQKD